MDLNVSAIGLVCLTIFCFFFCRFFKFSKGKEAPTVAGAWPILGHLPLLNDSKAPHRTLGALADKYGPIFTVQLGSKKTLVISNWEMAKECFTTNDTVVSSRPKLAAAEHMTYNKAMFSVAPCGPYWRTTRKIATSEILSPHRVKQLRHVFESEVQGSIKELFNFWCSNKNECGYALVELKQWFSHLIFNVVLQMVLGKRYFSLGTVDDEKAGRCVKAVKEFMRLFGVFTVGDAVPWLRWFDFGGHEKAMKETAKEMDSLVSEWLEEHRQNKALGGKVDGFQDFMDVMISMLDGQTNNGVDADTMIKSTVLEQLTQSVLLLPGGFCTKLGIFAYNITKMGKFNQIYENGEVVGAQTISNEEVVPPARLHTVHSNSVEVVYPKNDFKTLNPNVLEKVKEELHIVGKEKWLSENDITKLIYLQATVKETLRLYPPAPLSAPHEFTEDCTINGYNVTKGTRLITNLWKIHTDEYVWSDPLEFKPERFLTTHKDIDMKGHHFELLPFGGG
ncbi:hypothetical protein LR48_Vigan203s000400 [Vigna angularis]|uniref:Cytochrome P450 n=1 Tax=Phaseolus angularis TaxID=3914 RepID=A0A0L9T5K4_PHAAN|nr:hypothetical protein LR48_Vigan203s000400 [Vigna angularis]